jgi:hypothetical protein
MGSSSKLAPRRRQMHVGPREEGEKVIVGPTLYTINQKYFTKADISFLKRSILLTAVTVGDFCHHHTSGELPEGKRQKEVVIEAMVKKIFRDLEKNETEEFTLFLDPTPIATIKKQGVIAKFDHHGDTSSWVLSLTEGEFKKVQHAWRTAGLPPDLFKSFCYDIVRPSCRDIVSPR